MIYSLRVQITWQRMESGDGNRENVSFCFCNCISRFIFFFSLSSQTILWTPKEVSLFIVVYWLSVGLVWPATENSHIRCNCMRVWNSEAVRWPCSRCPDFSNALAKVRPQYEICSVTQSMPLQMHSAQQTTENHEKNKEQKKKLLKMHE